MSEQPLAAGGGAARAPAGRPGGRGGLEYGPDGGGDKLRCLRVNDDVAAEQHAADDLPGVPGNVPRVGGLPALSSFYRCGYLTGVAGDHRSQLAVAAGAAGE